MDTLHAPPPAPSRFRGHDLDRPPDWHCRDLVWKCAVCDARLAFVDKETRSQVRIKRGDLFVTIGSPKWVKIMCRFCGVENTIKDFPEEKEPPVPPAEHAPTGDPPSP